MAGSLEHVSGLNANQRAEVETRIEAFEKAWQRGERPRIADHLPADAETRRAVLVELVRIDMERRTKAGEPARVESYRQEFPELADLLKSGEESASTLGKSIKTMPPTEIVEVVPEQPGTMIGPYKLMEQIGEGGFGLVLCRRTTTARPPEGGDQGHQAGDGHARGDRPLRGRASGAGPDGPRRTSRGCSTLARPNRAGLTS